MYFYIFNLCISNIVYVSNETLCSRVKLVKHDFYIQKIDDLLQDSKSDMGQILPGTSL